jgi:hypothetical protein
VNPVTANNSMAIRQRAELIQCHWCNWRNQTARRTPWTVGAAVVGTGEEEPVECIRK